MKRLLIGIDFSAASLHALHYSRQLAAALGFEITLAFANPYTTAESALPERAHKAMISREAAAYRQKLNRLMTDYPHEGEGLPKVPFSVEVLAGTPESALAAAAQQQQADFIAIGSRKKHSLGEQLFGSVSTDLIYKAACPVFIIPEGAHYTTVAQVALAISPEAAQVPDLPVLRQLASKLNAGIRPFSVSLPADGVQAPHRRCYNGTWADVVPASSIPGGIQAYLQALPAQWLAMQLPKRTLLQQWFHGQLLRQMAWQSPCPLWTAVPANQANPPSAAQ